MAIDAQVLQTMEASLKRVTSRPEFLDRFYDIFLNSSPKVKEKFAHTNFHKQKIALQGSLFGMVKYAHSGITANEDFMKEVAERHSSRALAIGSELYDLWLDSLLKTVEECDPESSPAVLEAWECVMSDGIRYFLTRY